MEKQAFHFNVVAVLVIGGLIAWLLAAHEKFQALQTIGNSSSGGCTNCGSGNTTNTGPEEGDATHEMYHSLGTYSTFVGTGGQTFVNIPFQDTSAYDRGRLNQRVM